jgi:predicted short-subunit dehydrogenase-like oxidoreductase (DUF2520 family)
MSTSPENHIVNLLSHWLARHVDNAELLRELDALDTSALTHAQAEAVQELRQELTSKNGRGDLEMAVRETLEAVALG